MASLSNNYLVPVPPAFSFRVCTFSLYPLGFSHGHWKSTSCFVWTPGLVFLFPLAWKRTRGPLTWVTFSVTWWVLSISLEGGLISPGGNVTNVFAFVSNRLWVICRSHWGHRRTQQGYISSLSVIIHCSEPFSNQSSWQPSTVKACGPH